MLIPVCLSVCLSVTFRYQQYNWLKQTHYCVISVLALFIVIAASRHVNKNVSTGGIGEGLFLSRKPAISLKQRR